jgi:hypothetical protein
MLRDPLQDPSLLLKQVWVTPAQEASVQSFDTGICALTDP